MTKGNLVRQAIALILHHPAAVVRAYGEARHPRLPPTRPELMDLECPGAAILADLISLAMEPDVTTAGLLEATREWPDAGRLVELAAAECLIADTDAADELRGILRSIVSKDSDRGRAARLIELAGQRKLSEHEGAQLRRLLEV